VVPSGLADSLNVPSLLGMMGGAGLVPSEGEHRVSLTTGGEPAGTAKGAGPDVAKAGPKAP
jgi:hypothetical protein